MVHRHIQCYLLFALALGLSLNLLLEFVCSLYYLIDKMNVYRKKTQCIAEYIQIFRMKNRLDLCRWNRRCYCCCGYCWRCREWWDFHATEMTKEEENDCSRWEKQQDKKIKALGMTRLSSLENKTNQREQRQRWTARREWAAGKMTMATVWQNVSVTDYPM